MRSVDTVFSCALCCRPRRSYTSQILNNCNNNTPLCTAVVVILFARATNYFMHNIYIFYIDYYYYYSLLCNAGGIDYRRSQGLTGGWLGFFIDNFSNTSRKTVKMRCNMFFKRIRIVYRHCIIWTRGGQSWPTFNVKYVMFKLMIVAKLDPFIMYVCMFVQAFVLLHFPSGLLPRPATRTGLVQNVTCNFNEVPTYLYNT